MISGDISVNISGAFFCPIAYNMVKIQFRNLILKIDFLAIEKIIQASSRENENLLHHK